MYIKQYPDQNTSSDVTFFSNGIRLSNDFVDREALEGKNYVSIYIDDDANSISFRFFGGKQPQSLKLTPSGENTKGKTISCAFLKKKYRWIKDLMEDKNINNRRFRIYDPNAFSSESDSLNYAVDVKITK